MVRLNSLAFVITLLAAALASAETVLLDFSADWCGPCQQMKPIVQQLAAAGHPVREVNVDRDRSLAAKYRVTSIPCFVMLVDGQEVDREVGGVSRSRLEQMLAKATSSRHAPAQERALAQSPDDGSTFSSSTRSAAPREPANYTNATAAPSRSASHGDHEQQLLRATVRLKVDDQEGHSYGTGTIIDTRGDEALVLTCGHLFRDSQGKGPISIDMFVDGQTRQVPGTLISYDLKRDLALVKFRPGVDVGVARVAPEAKDVSLGQRVSNVGCNNGDNPTVRRSRVTGIDKYLGPPNVEVAGLPVEGRSGGGLFDEQGRLIGVCYAADPADNEGVYAGLASIHAELDRVGLAVVYAPQTPADSEITQVAATEPPPMPERMPGEARADGGAPSRLNSVPQARDIRTVADGTSSGPATDVDVLSQLSPSERAALVEIGNRSEDAEVICIIRPLSNPEAKSEIIVLDKASPLFLEQLSGKRREQDNRRLTSHDVPQSASQPQNPWRGKAVRR